MNTDIRISVSFADHPKTIKLSRRLGGDAVICLIRLYGWIAQNKPLGVLDYASSINQAMLKSNAAEDIEIAAKWDGEPNLFYKTLVELKFIDEGERSISIHDWEEHNPYAFHANDRKSKAKKAAAARWGADKLSNAPSMQQASLSNAPSPDPSPSPSPNPKEKDKNQKGRFVPPTLVEVQEYCKQRNNSVDAETFINFYEASGWVRGKTKIKNWKACIITWEKRDNENKTTNSSETPWI